VLRNDPTNGFALVHLGFIVKTTDHDYAGAVPLLQEGIASNASGVIDGRFFFHLGDALYRTGQHNEVVESIIITIHESGVVMSSVVCLSVCPVCVVTFECLDQ